MAADQRRKRMNSANVIGFSSREHYRAKRKKIDSADAALHSKDHISLEWDGNRNKVVSKREQVGLSLRHLRQFVDVVPHRKSLLAQVCTVPPETFQLENLSDVLSNEVWQTCLSDGERNYLQKFLPEGVDVEQVVKALFDGENFHFGNPLLEWGTTVCSNEAHPDQIVYQEECMRADKRRYYSDLEKYHYDMIDYLQMLKEKWESGNGLENGADKKLLGRSRGGNNTRVSGSYHDLTDASESSSGNTDDNLCNGDNKTEEVQRRRKISALEKGKSQSPLIAQENVENLGVKARKKDKLPKHSIQRTDGAKYMSYLKISKKQYQIVTSMKQSGKSIQSKALNQILGNIKDLDVQPYGLFVEEEQKKLNAHWLQLVKDLPEAYAIWKKVQLQKRDIVNSLGRELKGKLNPWVEDNQQLYPAENHLQKHEAERELRNNDPETVNRNQSDYLAPDDEDSGSFGQVSAKNQSLSQDSSPDSIYPEDVEEKQYLSPSRCHSLDRKDVESSDYPSSMQCQSLPPASFPSEPHASGLEDTNPLGKSSVPELENASSDERIPCVNSSHGEESQFTSGGNEWRPVGGPAQSYIGHQAYTSSGGLSIIHHPQEAEEEKNCFIDLKSDMSEEADRRKILQLETNSGYGSYPNNDQNELLQSLFKRQGIASHTTQQLDSLLRQPMDIGFQQGGSSNLMGSNQFSGQFQHQMTVPQALSQDQQRRLDIYDQGNMQNNIYSDARGYLMQQSDWNTSVAQIGVSTQQPHLNTAPLLNQNWQFKSMWLNTNGVGYASQASPTETVRDQSPLSVANGPGQITHRGSGSDQSLFSVFSQCSQLRPAFDPESSVNNGVLMGGSRAQIGSNLVQPTNPLDFLSGSNPVTSLMPDDVGWMNQSRQNSGLHDPLYPPRSWNQ